MPDPVLFAQAMGIAAVAAAVVFGICSWRWPRSAARPSWVGAGWVLGVGAGFYLGCWVLGVRLHWPLLEDQDRLLALVFPAVLVVELLAASPSVSRWLIWPLRLGVAGGTARVLLHGSSYITDLLGPGTQEWSPVQEWLILAGLAAALAAVWSLLVLLAHRAPGLSHPVCLAVTIAGAAVTVMLSGYASGGQVGLPLAAALVGAAAAALVPPGPARTIGPLGVGGVGLFSLLVIGHFFGQLIVAHAILLFGAPLLAWIPELPYLRRLPAWARGLARVIVVGAAVAAVVAHAQWRFAESSQATSRSAPNEPSVEDYMNFGR
jgi:hypothetical protein